MNSAPCKIVTIYFLTEILLYIHFKIDLKLPLNIISLYMQKHYGTTKFSIHVQLKIITSVLFVKV
jgi:hypothetical protein